MTVPQTTEKHINDTITEMKEQLNLWQDRLNSLEEEIKHIKQEVQSKYQATIEGLQEELHRLQVRLQAMKEGDPVEWLNGRIEFQERYDTLKNSILNTAVLIQNEDKNVALGWLQGFTDERPHDSAGWVEGMGEQQEDTEGWAEGMGEKGPGSKGWAEGYNQQ